MSRNFLSRALLCLIPALALAACGGSSAADRGPVVLAASSLQEAMTDAADAWEAKGHPEPALSFAASSALARQVEQGAPADIFVSADVAWMDELEAKDLLRTGSRGDMVSNRLVMIAPKGAAPISLAVPGDERLALADPEAVPAGRYAKAALETLGLWGGLEDNVVPAENVRAALALVERGEAALGIVYATDALASDRVDVVERLPADSHPPILYPVAVLSASTNPEAAALRAFLVSDEARAIFERRGFEPVE